MRNRIINGAMLVSQRNGTSATSVSGNDVYTIDRYKGWANGGGVFSVTQSTTAPSGFSNSALITVTSADSSIAASDNYRFAQVIEGYNIADLNYGSSGAKSVTLSFWVQSSVTGTFGGSFYSSSATRSYVFNYTISSANTWTYITTTATGDTSGSWNNTNGQGMTIYFDLGSGSNYENATGSWVGSEKFRTSGNATLISTNGATWYVTGVQLEAGTTASPFEYRQYGTELALCQRYCCVIPVSSAGISDGIIGPWGANYNATNGRVWYSMPVTMRTTPSVSLTGNQYSIIGVNDTATGTNNNFHYSNQIISFDGTSLSSSSATGQPLNYRGGGLITAEL
jgi:hypothetical protein